MIDAKRNLNTTYRVNRLSDGIHLKTFPPAPEAVTEAWYRMDQIPQWLIEAMALLDAASPARIPDLGHRIGESLYWIEPPSRNTAGDRIAADINARLALSAKADDETDEALGLWWAVFGERHEKTP
jgi:hypothetical protein